MRGRALPALEMVNWVTLNWLPRAAAWFAPRLLRLAYVLPPARAAELAADPYLNQLLLDLLAPRPAYEVALFADEPPARHWLRR